MFSVIDSWLSCPRSSPTQEHCVGQDTKLSQCLSPIRYPNGYWRRDHFTVVYLVTWPLNGSEAGVDLVLIQTSLLLSCKSSLAAIQWPHHQAENCKMLCLMLEVPLHWIYILSGERVEIFLVASCYRIKTRISASLIQAAWLVCRLYLYLIKDNLPVLVPGREHASLGKSFPT